METMHAAADGFAAAWRAARAGWEEAGPLKHRPPPGWTWRLSWQAGALALTALAALYLVLKYQQLTRRLVRRLVYGDDEPKDALAAYPSAAVGDAEAATELSSSLSRARSDSDEGAGRAGTPAGAPSPEARLRSVAVVPPPPPQPVGLRRVESAPAVSEPGGGDDAAAGGSSGDVDARRRVAEVVRFLRLLRHTIQGIDLPSALSLFSRVDRVDVAPGAALFDEGDVADSMYIVLAGQLGWYRRYGAADGGSDRDGGGDIDATETAAMGSPPDVATATAGLRQLCTFGKGQVIGEHALVAGFTARKLTYAGALRGPSPAEPGAAAAAAAAMLASSVGGSSESGSGLSRSSTPSPLVQPAAATASGCPEARRPATCVALTPCRLLRLDAKTFNAFASSHPDAVVSYQLATTARGWRIAHYTLIEFLRMRSAWEASLEPETPPLRLVVAGGSGGGDGRHAAAHGGHHGGGDAAGDAASGGVGHPQRPPPIAVSAAALQSAAAAVLKLAPGQRLYTAGQDADTCYVVLSGSITAVAECPIPGPAPHPQPSFNGGSSPAVRRRTLGPGCIVGGSASFAAIPHIDTAVAGTAAQVAAFPRSMFVEIRGCPIDGDGMGPGDDSPADAVLLAVSLAVGRAQVPLLHLFSTLGLQRVWLRAGELLYRAGDHQDGLYVVISGRLRTINAAGTAAAGAVAAAAASQSTGGGGGSSGLSASYCTCAHPRFASGHVSLDGATTPQRCGVCRGILPLSNPPSLGSESAGGYGGATFASPDEGGLRRRPASVFVSGGAAAADTSTPRLVRGQSAFNVAAVAAAAAHSGGGAGSLLSPTGTPGAGVGAAGGSGAEHSDLHALVMRHGLRVDVGRGETVGEIAVLTAEAVRLSSAVCLRDCELVKISTQAFELITEEHPAVTAQLARLLALRYRHLTERLAAIAGGGGGGGGGGIGVGIGAALPPAGLLAGTSPSAGGGFAGFASTTGGVEGVLQRAIARSVETATPGGGGGGDVGAGGATPAPALPPAPPIVPAVVPPSGAHTAVRINSSFVTIAVVPAGAQPPAIHDFTRRLVAALGRTAGCAVLHLTAHTLDGLLGCTTTASLDEPYVRARVGAWLSSQEERHRFVVLEADEDPGRREALAAAAAAAGAAAAGGGSFVPPRGSLAAAAAGLGLMDGGGLASRARTIGRGLNRLIESSTGVAPAPILRRALAKLQHEWQGGPRMTEDLLLTALHEASARGGGGGVGGSGAGGSADSSSGGDGGGGSGSHASAWSALCVQQADLCLLVGQAHTPAALSATERQCVYRVMPGAPPPPAAPPAPRPYDDDGGDDSGDGSGLLSPRRRAAAAAAAATPAAPRVVPRSFAQRELVLLHADPSKPPRDTRAWLRSRHVASHHHVRAGHEGDVERVARFICGTAHGVVLGGGGSRGLAHLGVFRAFEEAGVPIDFVGGTSQGAFMAACYAATLSSSGATPMVAKLASALGSKLNLLQALTLPVHSYFSGHAFNDAIIGAFHDTQIEDLWIRYFAVTTDVTASSARTHTAGPLWRYCRASMSILGYMPLLRDSADGHLLADGGYASNLPVEVMRAVAPQVGTVWAVDVENKANPLRGIPDYGDSLSGWWLVGRWLASKLGLAAPLRIPSLSELSLRVAYISHSMLIRELLRRGDPGLVYMRPPVGSRFGLLDYHRAPEIIAAGYEEATASLARWRAATGQVAPAAAVLPHGAATASMT